MLAIIANSAWACERGALKCAHYQQICYLTSLIRACILRASLNPAVTDNSRLSMARFLEFLLNHWVLSGIWLGLLITLILYIKAKAGSALSPHQATLLVNRQNGVILDIRDKKTFDAGHIVDAINIPSAKLGERVTELEKFRDKPLVVVCQLGQQSGDAVKLLEEKGFSSVSRMHGGITEWTTQGLPLVK